MTATNDRPVFIISSPRSGSTLLRLIINSHSQIAVPPPTLVFPYIYPYLHTYGDLNEPPNLAVLVEDILELQKSKPWPMELTKEMLISACQEPSFAGVYSALHRIWADFHDKPRWGEKTPPEIYFIGDILACFPEARFVHIIRDGRDVAVDWMENLQWPKNVYSTACQWRNFISAALPWRNKLKSDQLLEIHYEDLARSPEETVRRVCAFLGEEYEPEMLTYYQSEETAKWSQSASCHRHVSKPITDDYVGIHKKRLTLSERRMLSGLIGQELRVWGYTLEDEPREIGREEEERYKLDGALAESWMFSFKQRMLEGISRRKEAGIWSEDD